MNWITTIQKLTNSSTPFAIATVFDSGGSSPREVGAKMIVLKNGQIYHTIGGGELEKQVIEQAQKCLENNSNGVFSYPLGSKTGQCCGGVVDICIETINIFHPKLHIFGSGHVSLAILKTLEDAPINLTVIDSREEWLSQARQYSCQLIHLMDGPESIINEIQEDPTQSAVVLTHSHDLDFAIINLLCQRNDFRYIGLIGSKTKWTSFKRRLKDAGRTEEEISKITCPIGVPLPGKTPAEIAVSFSAQILSLL